jgi:hypothetical protein
MTILNEYTEEQSPYFLGNKLTINQNNDNECLLIIAGEERRKIYCSTRSKKKTSIPISKVPNKSPWGKIKY